MHHEYILLNRYNGKVIYFHCDKVIHLPLFRNIRERIFFLLHFSGVIR